MFDFLGDLVDAIHSLFDHAATAADLHSAVPDHIQTLADLHNSIPDYGSTIADAGHHITTYESHNLKFGLEHAPCHYPGCTCDRFIGGAGVDVCQNSHCHGVCG